MDRRHLLKKGGFLASLLIAGCVDSPQTNNEIENQQQTNTQDQTDIEDQPETQDEQNQDAQFELVEIDAPEKVEIGTQLKKWF